MVCVLKEAELIIKQSLKKRNRRYNLTPEEYQDYYDSDTCWICGESVFFFFFFFDNSNKKICLDQ